MLNDRMLAPIFQSALRSDEWSRQVHGALGLLELGVDPDATRPLERLDARSQQAIVANGLDLGIVPPDLRRAWTARTTLAPAARILLFAEAGLGTDPARGRAGWTAEHLAPLLADADDTVALLAAALRREHGDPDAESTTRTRLAAVPPPTRERLTLWILDAIRQYRLSGSARWVQSLLGPDIAPAPSPEIEFAAVRTLLSIAPREAGESWRRLLARRDTLGHRIRCALVLAEYGATAPRDLWDLVPMDEPLLAALRRSGESLRDGAARRAALRDLAGAAHPAASTWLLALTDELDGPDAADVLDAIVLASDRNPRDRAQLVALSVRAATLLADRAPERAAARLAAAGDDTAAQEIMLLGLLAARHPEGVAGTADIRRVSASRADTLALVLAARVRERLNDEDLRRLGAVAAGGGRVSETIRVQAAWLYLRHSVGPEAATSAINTLAAAAERGMMP